MEQALDTFPRRLLHHAAVRPRHPATREKDLGIWQTWSWADVADEVRALACGLASIGFKRGDHLAIIGDNRPRLYWAMVAAQCVGGVPVPMYQDAPAAGKLEQDGRPAPAIAGVRRTARAAAAADHRHAMRGAGAEEPDRAASRHGWMMGDPASGACCWAATYRIRRS